MNSQSGSKWFSLLTLQRLHIFSPLWMFLLQLRISLHIMTRSSRHTQKTFMIHMSARVLKARKQSATQFVKCFSSTVQEYNFQVGSLVLVHNSHIKKEVNHKTKPHFLEPMVVVHHTKGGTYILSELNGAISRL